MEISNFFKLKKKLIRLCAHFILILLAFIEAAIDFMRTAFDGYGWGAFLARLLIVAISFTLNPISYAVQQVATGAIKLFLLTCGVLVYAIGRLIYDYTKFGKEAEAKRKAGNQ